MYIMQGKTCKNVDKEAISKFKIPSIVLMENAAEGIYREISDMGEVYTVICGTGNNGGDGLAVGRKLLLSGKEVNFIIINPIEKYSTDFKINLEIVKNISKNISYIKDINDIKDTSLIISKSNVIIDAIFGIGLNRAIDDLHNEIIEIVNNSKKTIIAVDVPSGLDCNEGIALGNAIRANYTYTFEVIKRGFINYSAFEYLGEMKVISIGIPEEIKANNSEKIYMLEKKDYRDMIKDRKIYGHKGDYGKAIIFAGSMGFTGAAYITTEACVKSGAGLVTLVTTTECQKILSSKLVEAMTANYAEKEKILELINKATAIAFGPGIGNAKEFEEILLWIVENSTAIIIIDAEGINILSRRADILKKLSGRAILTPHPGEMSKLIGKSIDDIEKDRVNIARTFAKENQCILLLKGFNTVITNGDEVIINNSGNSKMASGGMGDCLTGIITALVSQGYDGFIATKFAAYVHGITGENQGENKFSIIASDVIDNISNNINSIIIN